MGVCNLFLKLIVFIVFQIACAQHQHAHPHPTSQAKLEPSLNERILPNLKGSVHPQRHPSGLHADVQSRLYNSHSQLDDDDEKRINRHLTSSAIYHHLDQDPINNRGLPFFSNIKDDVKDLKEVSDIYQQPVKLGNLAILSKVNVEETGKASTEKDDSEDESSEYRQGLLLQKPSKFQNKEQSSESISSRSHVSDVYEQPTKLKNLIVLSKVNTKSQNTADDDSGYQDDNDDDGYSDSANRLLLQKLSKSQNQEQSSESISSRSHVSDVYEQPTKLKNLIVLSKVNTKSQNTADDDSGYQDDDDDGYSDPANRLLLQKLSKSQNQEQSSESISSRSHVSDVYEQPTKLKNLIVLSKVNTKSQNTADDDSGYQDDDDDGYSDPANRLLLQKLSKSQNQEPSSESISSRSHVSDVYEQPTKLKNLIVLSKVNTKSQNTADDDSGYQDDNDDDGYSDPANRLLLQKLSKSQNQEQSSESISSRSHVSDVYEQPTKLKNLIVLSKVNTKSQNTADDDSGYQDDDDDGYSDPANRLLLQKLSKSQNQEQSSESISSRSHVSDVYEQPTKLKNLIVLSKVNTKSQNTADDDSGYQDDDDDGYSDPANRLLLQKLSKSQNQEPSSESISSRSHVSDVYQQPTKLKNLVVMSKVNIKSQNTAEDDSDYQDDDDDDRYADPANRLLLQKRSKSQNQEQSSESISSRSHVSDVYEQPTKLKNLIVLSKVNTKSQNTADDDLGYQDDDDDGYSDPANRLLLQKLSKSQNQEQSSESISSRSHVSDVYEQPTKLKNLIVLSKVNTKSQNTAEDDSDYQDDDDDDRYADPANRLLLQKRSKTQNQEQSSDSISSRSHVSDVYEQPTKLKNLIVLSKVNTKSQNTADDDSDYQDDNDDDGYSDPENRLLLQKLSKSQNQEQSSESISSRSQVSDVYQQPTKLKNLMILSKVNTKSQNPAEDDSDYQNDDDDDNDRYSVRSRALSRQSHVSDVYEQPTKLKNLVILSKVNTNSQKPDNDADNSDDDQSDDDGSEDDVDSRNASPVESRKFPFNSNNAEDVYEQPVQLGNLAILSKINTDSLNSVGGSKKRRKSKRRKHRRRPVQSEESEEYEQPEQSEQSEQPEEPDEFEEPDESENNQQLTRSLPYGSNVDDVYQQPVDLENAVILSKVKTDSGPGSRNHGSHRNRKRYERLYPDNDYGYGRQNPYENDDSIAKRYYGSNDDDNNYQQPAKSNNVDDVYQQPVKLDNAVILSKVNTDSGLGSRNHGSHRNKKRYQRPYPDNDYGYGRQNPYENDDSVAKRYYGSNDDNSNYQQPAKSNNVHDVYQQPVKLGNAVILSKVNTVSGPESRNHGSHRNRKRYQRPYPDNDFGYGRQNPYENDNSVAKRYYGSNDDDNNYQQPAKSNNVDDVYQQPVKLGNAVILSKVNTVSGPESRNHGSHRNRKRYQRPYPDNDFGYGRQNSYENDDSVAKRYYGSNDDDNNYQQSAKSNNVDDVYQQPVKLDNAVILSKVNTDSGLGSRNHGSHRNKKRYQRPYPDNDYGYGRQNPYENDDSVAKRYYGSNDDDSNYQQPAKSNNVHDVYQQPVKLGNAVILSKVNTVSGPESRNHGSHRNRKRYQRPYPDNGFGYGRQNPYENDDSVAKRYYGSNDDDNNYQQPAKSNNVDDVYQQPVKLGNAVILSKVNTVSGPESRNHGRHRNRKRYQRPYPYNDYGYGRRNPYEDESVAKRYYGSTDGDNNYQRPAKSNDLVILSEVNAGSQRESSDHERQRNDDGYGRRSPYEDDDSIAKRYYGPNDDNDYQRPAKADGVALISQVNEGSSRRSEDRGGYRNRKRYQRPYLNNDDGYGRRNPYHDDDSIAKRYYGPSDDNDYQRPAKADGVALISQVNEGSSRRSEDRGEYRNRNRYQRPYPYNDDGYGRRNSNQDDDSIAKRYYGPNDDNDYQRPAKADGVALISQVNEDSSRGSEDREGYRQRKHHRPYLYDYEDSRRRSPYDDEMVNRKLPYTLGNLV